MIISKSYDVEIFPNLFSITFVDMKDYLDTFSDCVDDKGNPIALTEKLSVKEIKERLDKVKSDVFYISDTDDSQLLEIVGYINSMIAHYETYTDDDGNIQQYPVRYDLFGYNNSNYDDMMIRAFMCRFNQFDNTKELIKYLYKTSKRIIELQDDKEAFYKDNEIEMLREYRLPYATVDVQRIYALNAAGVNIDKDTGERVKFGKSLKQTSINLKWHELLDFKLPDIDEEEAELYWHKQNHYRGMSVKELNSLITNDFDRYVLPKYIHDMLHYNKNDVFLVCEIARQKPDEIKLRYSLGAAFKLNLLCASRANIADRLLVKFYSERSGLRKERFEKLRTERTRLSFNKVIFDNIHFETKELQDMLAEMKTVAIYRTSKDAFSKEIKFKGTTYTIATGGLHSKDIPGVYRSDDKFTYVHYDISSFYPSIMVAYNIAPKHINEKVFVNMVNYFRTTRIKAKHTKDEDEQVVKGVHNKLAAEALKIVINAIYGKFGSDKFWLYDRLAQLKVTINGQLMIIMLCERLELAGIHVISANTDGIIVKLPKDKREEFKEITDKWCKETKLSADSEEYNILVSRDINNYLDQQTDGKVEYKGALDPKQYLKDLKKGYDMPIVAIAVSNYFLHNIPIMETLKNHKDILDFCKTQNVGKQFDVVYDTVINGNITSIYSQRHVRFYVSTKGVVLQKEHNITHKRSRLASGLPVKILNSLDDVPIELRDIDYRYYYDEAYKILNPILLSISSNQKADTNRGVKSGKVVIKKYSHEYQTLFNDDDFN